MHNHLCDGGPIELCKRAYSIKYKYQSIHDSWGHFEADTDSVVRSWSKPNHYQPAWMQWGLPVEKGQVEGSKICIKVLIDELIVDAEVVCVCSTLGLDRSLEGDKIKPLLDVFTGTHQNICSLVHCGECFKGWFCFCDAIGSVTNLHISLSITFPPQRLLHSWNVISDQEKQRG